MTVSKTPLRGLTLFIFLALFLTGCGTKTFEKPLKDFDGATSALLTLTSDTYSEFQEVRRERSYLEYWVTADKDGFSTDKVDDFLARDITLRKELEDGFDKQDIKVRKEVINELKNLIKLLTKLTEVDPKTMADSFKVSGERFKALGGKFEASSNFNKSLTNLGSLVGTTLAQAVQRRKYKIVRDTLKKMEPEVSTITTILKKDLEDLYDLYEKDLAGITTAYKTGLRNSRLPGLLTLRQATADCSSCRSRKKCSEKDCCTLKNCLADSELLKKDDLKSEVVNAESILNASSLHGGNTNLKLAPVGLLVREDRGLSLLLVERLQKHQARVANLSTRKKEHIQAIEKMNGTFKKLAEKDVSSSDVISQIADYLGAVDDFVTTMEAVEESK